MYKSIASAKEMSPGQIDVAAQPLEIGNSRLGLGLILCLAALVGAWGTACLVNGLGNCGGLNSIGTSLVMALTGI